MTSLKTHGIITLKGNIPALETSPRVTSPAAQQKELVMKVAESAQGGRGVYLDFADSISRLGESAIRERYGNLFQMYERITGENAYQRPMRIYPRSTTRWVGFGLTIIS